MCRATDHSLVFFHCNENTLHYYGESITLIFGTIQGFCWSIILFLATYTMIYRISTEKFMWNLSNFYYCTVIITALFSIIFWMWGPFWARIMGGNGVYVLLWINDALNVLLVCAVFRFWFQLFLPFFLEFLGEF
jgi:hypothetical protein